MLFSLRASLLWSRHPLKEGTCPWGVLEGHDGALPAYAVGYDWHQAPQGNASASLNKRMLLSVTADAVKPRER